MKQLVILVAGLFLVGSIQAKEADKPWPDSAFQMVVKSYNKGRNWKEILISDEFKGADKKWLDKKFKNKKENLPEVKQTKPFEADFVMNEKVLASIKLDSAAQKMWLNGHELNFGQWTSMKDRNEYIGRVLNMRKSSMLSLLLPYAYADSYDLDFSINYFTKKIADSWSLWNLVGKSSDAQEDVELYKKMGLLGSQPGGKLVSIELKCGGGADEANEANEAMCASHTLITRRADSVNGDITEKKVRSDVMVKQGASVSYPCLKASSGAVKASVDGEASVSAQDVETAKAINKCCGNNTVHGNAEARTDFYRRQYTCVDKLRDFLMSKESSQSMKQKVRDSVINSTSSPAGGGSQR